jgi:hypothetical protein
MRRFLIEFTVVLLRLSQGQMNFTPPSQPPRPAEEKASPLAVMTLLAGIASWTVLPFFGGFLGIIFGLIELGNIKKGQSPEAGKLITTIGFYASIANIGMTIAGTCALAFFFGGFGVLMAALASAGQLH